MYQGGLARKVGLAFEVVRGTEGARLLVVDSLPDGRVLTGGPDGRGGREPGGTGTHYTFADGLPATQVHDIYVTPAPDAEAWIATDGGLSKFVAQPAP